MICIKDSELFSIWSNILLSKASGTDFVRYLFLEQVILPG